MTTISTPSELITAVPFLLNTHPENSLVLIALSQGAVEVAIALPLPTATDTSSAILELTSSAEFLTPIREVAPDQLLLLAYLPSDYGTNESDNSWSHLQSLCEEIAPVKDFLIIHSGRWRSFLCKDEECCDPKGEPLPDINSSQFAAEHVFQGFVMPPSATGESHSPLAGLIREAEREYQQCDPSQRSKRGVIALLRLISHFAMSRELTNNRLIADALVALTDIHVRDFGIGSHGDENLTLHCELWNALLECAPESFRAPVATLLALVRYESGDRKGAASALELALCDNPHYSLAHLLQKTFAAGWPPEAFTTMRHELHPKLEAELLG